MNTRARIEKISILGCGWYGLPLAQRLADEGYKVKGSSTSSEKFIKFREHGIMPFEVSFKAEEEVYDPFFFDCDVLIVSVPPKRNSGEVGPYPDKIKRIADAVRRHRVKRLLFISSTSVYGDCDMEVTEEITPRPDTESGNAILAAENILRESNSPLTTILRFGGLIGPGRNPARFFAGKMGVPNGKAPVNLIHLEDCISLSLAIIQKDAFGYTFNACCTDHPSKMDFYKQAAIKSELTPPQFIEELRHWKIVSSKYLDTILGIKIDTLEKS